MTGEFGAIWVGPPADGNWESGRRGFAAGGIVDHHTDSTLDAALARFRADGAVVSAHFIVDKDGTVYQMVAIADTAYHAGDLTVNLGTVGIEHVSYAQGTPGYDEFPDAQYAASAALHRAIAAEAGFDLVLGQTVRPHSAIVPTQCPGALDLNRLVQEEEMLDTNDPTVQTLLAGAAAAEYALHVVETGTATPDLPPDQQHDSRIHEIEKILAAQGAVLQQILDAVQQPAAGGGSRQVTGTFSGTVA